MILLTSKAMKVPIASLLLIGLLIVHDAFAQPQSDDIYREYIWLPDMVREQEKFLRVGGRLDYQTAENHMPAAFHDDGFLTIDEEIDLQEAIRAEMVFEMVQSHEDTKGLALQVNQGHWISVPDIPTLPRPQSNYMLHTFPSVTVGLEDLIDGEKNRFRLKVDTSQVWRWPQNIFYAVILRVYYSKSKLPASTTQVGGIATSGKLNLHQKLFLQSFDPASVKQVDYFALCEDFNWEGDGRYYQWHGHTHRGRLANHVGSSSKAPFQVIWDTEWIPDQRHPIKLRARVQYQNGIYRMTPPVSGLKLDRSYSIILCHPYHQPENWVTRQDSFTANFAIHGPLDEAVSYQIGWRSWSPCYGRGVFINGTKIWDKEDPCYGYSQHLITRENTEELVYGENIIATGKTPLIDGKMVHGMEVQYPGIMVKLKFKNRIGDDVVIREGTYESRPHYIIRTPNAIYYYDLAGGGFSRMLDHEGKDWINFKMNPWDTYPASAASAYRGIPNLVFRSEESGAGHPGHNQCISKKLNDHTIRTQSKSGLWEWQWEFFDEYAKLTMLKVVPGHPYWFLYEGVPGGRFEPDHQYFGTDKDGPMTETPDHFAGMKKFGNWRWAYFGHKLVNRVLFVGMENKDKLPDAFSYLGNTDDGVKSPDGMVVFGFGRADGAKPQMTQTNTFYLGFRDGLISSKNDHQELKKFYRKMRQ